MKTESLRRKWTILVLLITLVPSLIHSQDSLSIIEPSFFSEYTSIQYRQLNELKKFVEYKAVAVKLLAQQEQEINELREVIEELNKIIERYELELLPSLQRQISILAQRELNTAKIHRNDLVIKDAEYQQLKSRRMGLSLYGGYGLTVENPQFSVGIAFTYTFLRF